MSAELRVNGREVLSVGPGGGQFDLTAARRKALSFGNNHIEVSAVKAPGERCNVSTAPGKQTGVVFNVYGELAADHGVNQPKAPNEYWRAKAGRTTMKFDGVAQVKNVGPGGLARVPLYISIEYPTGYLHLLDESGRHPIQELTPSPASGAAERRGPPPTRRRSSATPPTSAPAPSLRSTFQFGIADVAELENRIPIYVNWRTYGNTPPGSVAKTTATVVEWACTAKATDPLCPEP